MGRGTLAVIRGTGHAVDRFADYRGLERTVAQVMCNPGKAVYDAWNAMTTTGLFLGKLTVIAMARPEVLADRLHALADTTVEHFMALPPEQRIEKSTEFFVHTLLLFSAPGLAAGAAAAAAGSFTTLRELPAVITCIRDLTVALKVETHAALALGGSERAFMFNAPLSSVVNEVYETGLTAAACGAQATKKAIAVVTHNPQLVGKEAVGGVVREIAQEVAEHSGTVWDCIKMTDPMYNGTRIPKSFEMTVGRRKFWVAPNASDHLREYIAKRSQTHGMPINSQSLLRSFHSAVEKAVEHGIRYTEHPIAIDGWDLLFDQPRQEGLLPVVYHALYKR